MLKSCSLAILLILSPTWILPLKVGRNGCRGCWLHRGIFCFFSLCVWLLLLNCSFGYRFSISESETSLQILFYFLVLSLHLYEYWSYKFHFFSLRKCRRFLSKQSLFVYYIREHLGLKRILLRLPDVWFQFGSKEEVKGQGRHELSLNVTSGSR